MSDSSEVYEIYSEAELREKVTQLFEDKHWETKTLQYAEDSSEERSDLIPDIALLYNGKLIGIVKVKMYESAKVKRWNCWLRRKQEEAEQEAEQLIKGSDAQFVMFFINKKAIIYAKGNEKDSYKIRRVNKIPEPEEEKINDLISGAEDVSTIKTKGDFARVLNSKSASQKEDKKQEADEEARSENSKEINGLIDSLERLIARHQLNVNNQDPLSYSEKLHLLDIYQSEHQHRDGMYWKQAFAYFAAIFSLIILPRTNTFQSVGIPQQCFSVAGGLLALAWVPFVLAYERRFMSINDAYNRVNQMLPEYYRRGPLYKEAEACPLKRLIQRLVNLRMTTVVGVIFALLLCILAFIIWKYPIIISNK